MTVEIVLNIAAIALLIATAFLYFGARRLNRDTRALLNQITRQQHGARSQEQQRERERAAVTLGMAGKAGRVDR